MRLDLRALRSFVAVASAGSISSAAQSLHIAQPALSVQIKQLEEQLGAALFDRHPRGVVPTAVGERLGCRNRLPLSSPCRWCRR